jgi:hypothetical protein
MWNGNPKPGYGNAVAAESDKEHRFPQPLGKVRPKKRPDFPTFPQPLLLDK